MRSHLIDLIIRLLEPNSVLEALKLSDLKPFYPHASEGSSSFTSL